MMGRPSLMRNGMVEVPADEFQTWASKIYIYNYNIKQHYKLASGETKVCICNASKGIINVPKAIWKALNLQHQDIIEVAVRKPQREGK